MQTRSVALMIYHLFVYEPGREKWVPACGCANSELRVEAEWNSVSAVFNRADDDLFRGKVLHTHRSMLRSMVESSRFNLRVEEPVRVVQ